MLPHRSPVYERREKKRMRERNNSFVPREWTRARRDSEYLAMKRSGIVTRNWCKICKKNESIVNQCWSIRESRYRILAKNEITRRQRHHRSELTNLRRQKQFVTKAFLRGKEKDWFYSRRRCATSLPTPSRVPCAIWTDLDIKIQDRTIRLPEKSWKIPRARAEIGGCCVEYRSHVRDRDLTRYVLPGITYYETPFCVDLRNNRRTSRPSSSVSRFRADRRRL